MPYSSRLLRKITDVEIPYAGVALAAASLGRGDRSAQLRGVVGADEVVGVPEVVVATGADHGAGEVVRRVRGVCGAVPGHGALDGALPCAVVAGHGFGPGEVADAAVALLLEVDVGQVLVVAGNAFVGHPRSPESCPTAKVERMMVPSRSCQCARPGEHVAHVLAGRPAWSVLLIGWVSVAAAWS